MRINGRDLTTRLVQEFVDFDGLAPVHSRSVMAGGRVLIDEVTGEDSVELIDVMTPFLVAS